MMRNLVRKFVRSVLEEGKVDDLKAKYVPLFKASLEGNPSDASVASIVNILLKQDPSPTKKFSEWLLKTELMNLKLDGLTDTSDIRPTLDYFQINTHKFPKKDINAYKSIKDLENEVKRIDAIPLSKRKQTELASTNAAKLYEDEHVLLVRPDDKSATMKYGSGTKWCITMRDTNYYEEYTANNVIFYFVIVKSFVRPKDEELETGTKFAASLLDKVNMTKCALAIERDHDNRIDQIEYFDAEDNSIKGQTKFIDEWNATWWNLYPGSGLESEKLIKKLHTIAEEDAKKRPKTTSAKIASGEPVTDDEIISYWTSSYDEKQRKIGMQNAGDKNRNMQSNRLTLQKFNKMKKLTVAQQKVLAKIDSYVHDLVFGERCFVGTHNSIARKLNFGQFGKLEREDDGTTFMVTSYNTPQIASWETERGDKTVTLTAESPSGEVVDAKRNPATARWDDVTERRTTNVYEDDKGRTYIFDLDGLSEADARKMFGIN